MTTLQALRLYNHLVFTILLCLFTLFTRHISGATINVPADAATIQAAINLAAASGDTIQIAAGTYIEEIKVINKSLNIVGAGENNTIIQAPGPLIHLTQNFLFAGTTYWCVVMVDNQAAPTPQTVNISALTVDGDSQQDTFVPPQYGAANRFFAIGYHNANGTVQNAHTINTRQTSNFTELAGGGILNASDIGTVVFHVTNCLVNFYQRTGIDCRGSALTATITNNTVDRAYILPPGPSITTPNGIQFFGSASGTITSNTVSNNIASVANASGSGIILFQTNTNVAASNNNVSNNDVGIAAVQCGNNLSIDNNSVNFLITPGPNTPVGIEVDEPVGLTTISSNIMNNIPGTNMYLLSPTNQPYNLMNNQFIGAQTGLIVEGGGATGPIVTMNNDVFTGTLGYYIQEILAPNDIWPSTASVSFDGLVSGQITMAEFNWILTKIYDQHNDASLGLVLDFITPPPAPLPPSNFIGVIKKNKFLNKTEYRLKARWDASPSADVTRYRIYKNGRLVDELLAGSPLIFVTCLSSKNAATQYQVVAVNSNNIESTPISIRIIND